jgi:hypothetical protein
MQQQKAEAIGQARQHQHQHKQHFLQRTYVRIQQRNPYSRTKTKIQGRETETMGKMGSRDKTPIQSCQSLVRHIFETAEAALRFRGNKGKPNFPEYVTLRQPYASSPMTQLAISDSRSTLFAIPTSTAPIVHSQALDHIFAWPPYIFFLKK